MQITIQKMWPLEAGRKSGGFKGTDGTNYYCEIPVYHMLGEGMTIDAPAEKYVSKAGKTSYILSKDWKPNAPQTAQGAHTPAPTRQNGNGSSPFRTPSEMFVSEIVASAMRSGKFDTQDIKLLALAAVETWKEVESRLH